MPKRHVLARGYKGFSPDMICLNFKYELGEKYEIPQNSIELCVYGFHFCKYPQDVSEYYSCDNTVFAIVEAEGKIIESVDECVTNCITIIRIITQEELIKVIPEHIIRIGDSQAWYKDNKLHRDGDLPAVINGKRQEWWKDNKLHRDDDLPAVIVGRRQEWWKNGNRHRDGDIPAVIDGNEQEWWKDGKEHRNGDLPAWIHGHCQLWYKEGKLHRDSDLPALIDGQYQEWWKNGILSKNRSMVTNMMS